MNDFENGCDIARRDAPVGAASADEAVTSSRGPAGVGPWPGGEAAWPVGERYDPELLRMGDHRNVEDRYRYWTMEAIRADVAAHALPFEVAVENLDQGGYLVRAGMSGSKFYTFTITEKGLAALPALSGKEAEMAEEFLNPLYVQLLKVVKENPEQQAEFVQKNGIKSMRMSAICSHLTRRGYVVEGGLFKRKLRITEKGAAALQKYA